MQLPAQFGKYQLEKFLGGGMSRVYKATDTVLGRTVAVKILTDEGCRDEDAKKRFLLEARLSGNIVHDNIIRIHDYGEVDGRPFIVMEFLTGEDLRGAIEKGHTGDLKQKINIALQAARALGHVHQQNIIHRDIKPENLHVDTAGRVRLMDFGIAKAQNLSLTKTGFAIGTPYYMAPEQVLGKQVTPAADIYAFGLVLCELQTGQKPVAGDSIEVLFYQILHHPLDLSAVAQQPGMPPELVNLIQRCASKKAEERPASFEVVIAELEAIYARLGGGGTQAAPAYLPGLTQPWQQPAPQPMMATQPLGAQAMGTQALGTPPLASAPPQPSPPPPAASRNMMPILLGVGAAAAAGVIGYLVMGGSNKAKEEEKKPEVAFTLPQRYVDPLAGAEMFLIDAGYFKFDKEGRQEFLEAYYIDRTEVTKAQWAKYAQAKNQPTPEGDPNEPIASITIADARAFAEWAGKLLPSGRHYEKAARGTDGRMFPWGNNETGWKANLQGSPGLPEGKVQPATAELGVSPYGLLNIAGNVWEFVDERRPPSQGFLAFYEKTHKKKLAPGTELYTARGGSYATPLVFATAYEFVTVLDQQADDDFGFRCVKPAKLVELELKKKQ